MNLQCSPKTGSLRRLLLAVLVGFALFSCTSRPKEAAPVETAKTADAPAGGASSPAMDTASAPEPVEREEAELAAPLASPRKKGSMSKSLDAGAEDRFDELMDGESFAAATSSGPREGGLKAGYTDDHRQYNYFLDFLERFRQLSLKRELPVANRVVFEVQDRAGRPFPNVELAFTAGNGEVLDRVMTNADGRAFVTLDRDAVVAARFNNRTLIQKPFDSQGPRTVSLSLDAQRAVPAPPPLDIVFILDTTGSMGGEIERLRTTIDIIRENLDLATPRPRIRFGLVLYKDRGDDYVTASWPLTGDMKTFRKNLAKAEASGGGDTPEDLEAALDVALADDMGWNKDGGRIAFIITDAPAQLYPDAIGYDASTARAREKGVRIHSIGTGGLPTEGEVQLRQIAWRTRGSYIFLTYGERGESAGGKPGAVSHHTGDNWTAERLETIIIRLARDELAALSGVRPAVPADDWFRATSDDERSSEDVLDELFNESLKRLVDYSSFQLTAETPVSLAAIQAGEAAAPVYTRNAERFHARLLQSAVGLKRFKLVEREGLQAILEEVELALSAAAGGAPSAKLAELLGAEFLILPLLREVEEGGDWEVYLRLVRVRTAEILSVSRARIDRSLSIK